MLRMWSVAVLFAVASAEEESSTPTGDIPDSVPGAHFFEPFQPDWEAKWKVSKDADFSGRWNLEEYQTSGISGDKGLVVSDPARKHAVSTLFTEPVVPETAGLVVQYELQLKNGEAAAANAAPNCRHQAPPPCNSTACAHRARR